MVQLLSGSTVEADFHEKLLKQIGATFLPARLLLPQIRYNKVLPAQNVWSQTKINVHEFSIFASWFARWCRQWNFLVPLIGQLGSTKIIQLARTISGIFPANWVIIYHLLVPPIKGTRNSYQSSNHYISPSPPVKGTKKNSQLLMMVVLNHLVNVHLSWSSNHCYRVGWIHRFLWLWT